MPTRTTIWREIGFRNANGRQAPGGDVTEGTLNRPALAGERPGAGEAAPQPGAPNVVQLGGAKPAAATRPDSGRPEPGRPAPVAPQRPEPPRGGPAVGHRGNALVAHKPPQTALQSAPHMLPAPRPATPPRPPVAQPAAAPGSARLRPRHRGALAAFVLLVLLPFAGLVWYLYAVAEDQYASLTSFSVRREDQTSPMEMLGGFAGLSTGSSSDTDILYEFIRSQDMVARIDARLDLRAMYGRPGMDPLFTLPPDASIEDLRDHWQRMVRISYDQGDGIIELTALAFTAEGAQALASAILEESTAMINDLSTAARADATRHAQAELDRAMARLQEARAALTGFRSSHQIVDPEADLQSQMGVIDTLNTQLAEALIELDLLLQATDRADPRVRLRQDKIAVIEARIAAERGKFGAGSGGEAYATVVGEFERLTVEREFAEQSYLAALAAHDLARAEAQRQNRYLAAHVRPTLAETAEYPQRLRIAALAGLFLMLGWSVLTLIAWSIRDRR